MGLDCWRLRRSLHVSKFGPEAILSFWLFLLSVRICVLTFWTSFQRFVIADQSVASFNGGGGIGPRPIKPTKCQIDMFDVYWLPLCSTKTLHTRETEKRVSTSTIICIIVHVFSSRPQTPVHPPPHPPLLNFKRRRCVLWACTQCDIWAITYETFVWACMCYSLVTKRVQKNRYSLPTVSVCLSVCLFVCSGSALCKISRACDK